MSDKIWRVLELLKWGEEWLGKKGIEQSRLNMEFLLGKVLGKKRVALYVAFEEAVSEEKLEELKQFLQRRVAGEPLMYILGETEFHGCRIKVNRSAMIPRSETEGMMDTVLEEAKKIKPEKIVDLGTGTGCLAIILARNFPEAAIFAVDKSKDALELAKENAGLNQVSGKIEFLCEDMFSWMDRNTKVDLIVANPPYISLEEFEKLDMSDEGDGMLFLKEILAHLPGILNPAGLGFLEFGFTMGSRMLEEAQKNGLKAKLYKDIHGLDRFVKIQL